MDKIKIMIIDDEVEILDILKSVLVAQVTDQIVTCESAEEALNQIEGESPHLIISDIRMKKMNGIDFIRALRSKGILTPLIFLTAFGTKKYVIDALRLGATDFIEKPFSEKLLLETINKCVEIHKRENDLKENPNLTEAEIQKNKMIGLLKATSSKG